MRILSRCAVVCFLAFYTSIAGAQGNDNLQIHFIDVGQGDAALLVSPDGQTVLFDDGVRNNCDLPVSYLDQAGVTEIDYHITSHYHADHIGCAKEVLDEFPLQIAAIDRGGSYSSGTFDTYKTKVGSKRREATKGEVVTLDEGTSHEVTITVLAINGNEVPHTSNENDKSLLAKIDFGDFDAVIGGDLSGFDTSRYKDIETSVASSVGPVEVYKVHHHGSYLMSDLSPYLYLAF